MMTGITIQSKVHFRTGRRSRKQLHAGEAPPPVTPGRVPRVAKLVALALRFERLVRDGDVADYAELARLGHVTRARMSQLMLLLNLAPDIQEAILFLPRVTSGKDPLTERDIRPIAATPDWRKQREMWRELLGSLAAQSGSTP